MDAEKPDPEQQKIANGFLMQAVTEANADRIDLCVQKGADISHARNDSGYTPLMQAVLLGNEEVVKRVLKHNPGLFVKDAAGRTAYDFIRYVNDWNTRQRITDIMLNALPDHVREQAKTPEEAVKIAAREAANGNDAGGPKQPGIVAPKAATFGQKAAKPQKGFSL